MPDSQQDMKCPACGSEMQKVFIPNKGINIDVCSQGCGGIYFDNKEIQEFSSADANLTDITSLLENKNFMPVDVKQTRICPACGTPMAKTFAFGIEIDTCYKCGGIFLDYGEFEKVRTHFKKKEKIQPINLSARNDIDLEQFLKEAQQEEFCSQTGNSRMNLLAGILDTLCRNIYYRGHRY